MFARLAFAAADAILYAVWRMALWLGERKAHA